MIEPRITRTTSKLKGETKMKKTLTTTSVIEVVASLTVIAAIVTISAANLFINI